MDLLNVCEEIRDLEEQRNDLDWKVETLKAEVSAHVGIDYDEWSEGMRFMFAPIEHGLV